MSVFLCDDSEEGDDVLCEAISEESGPDVGYIRLSPAVLAVHAVERAAGEVAAASAGALDRWWFAITDAHQALTAALVEALSGTAEIGALRDDDAVAWLKYFEESRTNRNAKPPAEGHVATFMELVARAQDPARANDMHGTLVLTEDEKKDLKRLNTYRNDLDHVKPRHWSLQVAGLPRILAAAANALGQLFAMTSIRLELEDADIERAEQAISSILDHGPSIRHQGASSPTL